MAWVEDIFIHTEFFANAHNIWSCVANLGLCAREREWRGDVGQSRRCQPVNLSVLSTSKRADEITYCTLSRQISQCNVCQSSTPNLYIYLSLNVLLAFEQIISLFMIVYLLSRVLHCCNIDTGSDVMRCFCWYFKES